MKKSIMLSVFIMVLAVSIGGLATAGEKAPQSVFDLASSTLTAFGTDPVIVKAVEAQNSAGKSLGEIKAMDAKWKDHAGLANYMQALMDSDCGKHLRSIQDQSGFYSEIFVMDNQGANVAMTDKTSDYWQGDEAKFQKSFNNGTGAVFVDEVEFDDSSQAYLVQVSVPVKDGNKVIGAITFGIDIDNIE